MHRAPRPFARTSKARSKADGFVFEQLERRELLDVTVGSALDDVVQNSAGAVLSVSLLGRYTDTSVTQVVRLVTNVGTIDISLRGDWAPNTVANFLTYVSEGFYNNTIFHRSQRPTFTINYGLIQGGGFRPPTTDYNGTVDANNQPSFIPTGTDPGQVHDPIALEHPTGNVAYSVGLARSTNPDSGTSQFYINVTNNTGVFDAGTNPPGYATFGSILGFTRSVVDAINNYTYYNASGVFNSALGSMPLLLPSPLQLPVRPTDYLTIISATLLSDLTGVETATWSASVTDNPSLASVSIDSAGNLLVTPNTTGTRGTATIRLRATSADGTTFTDDEFTYEITNFAPSIGGMQGQSNVAVGGSMLLSAFGVLDNDAAGFGGVASVQFWFDADGNGEFDENLDTLLGSDASSEGGWNARISTAGMANGANNIFARVIDTDGATAVSMRTVTLGAAVPTTGVNPGSTTVSPGSSVNLGFDNGLPDTTGLRRISIFYDTDGDGILNPLNDRLIGFATYNTGSSSWGFTVSSEDLSLGVNRIFARVSDNYGNLGGITSSEITVEVP
ncbi:MAG: peptidylprolyl isomerase [Phycisphaerales bacterium]|nr:peptidylprolyl isomerase [Phycisphaerales bacterium]